MQAARDNIKDPPGIFIKVGLESLRGTLRFIESDLPRAFGGLHDMRVLGDLADASTEAAEAIGSLHRVPRERPGAARAGHLPSRARRASSRSCGSTKGSRSTPIGCSRSPTASCTLRRRSSARSPRASIRSRRIRSPRGRAPRPTILPLGQVVSTAQEQLDELKTFIQRQDIVSLPGSADVQVAPTPRFYRWTFASMWTPGPFETRPLRAYYYITDADPSWPADRQEEHLRDFNYGALWAISIHEVLPRTLPPLPAPAPGVGHAAQVDPLLVDRDGRGLGALRGADDDRGRLPQAGPGGPPRPARRSADPAVPLDRRHPAALRGSVGRTGGPASSATRPTSRRPRRAAKPSAGPSIPATCSTHSAS